MKKIAIESPYSDNIARNVRYLAWCIKAVYDCDHAAYAGHGLGPCAYPEDEIGRTHGLAADAAMAEICDEVWFFVDLGWSRGMSFARNTLERARKTWHERYLPIDDWKAFDRGEWPPGSTLRWVPAGAQPEAVRQ